MEVEYFCDYCSIGFLRCTTHETQLTAGAIENTLIWEVAYCFWKWLIVSNQGYFL